MRAGDKSHPQERGRLVAWSSGGVNAARLAPLLALLAPVFLLGRSAHNAFVLGASAAAARTRRAARGPADAPVQAFAPVGVLRRALLLAAAGRPALGIGSPRSGESQGGAGEQAQRAAAGAAGGEGTGQGIEASGIHGRLFVARGADQGHIIAWSGAMVLGQLSTQLLKGG